MLEISWHGRVPYTIAWEWQKQLAQELAQEADKPDQLLLLEHPPTITLGNSADVAHLLSTPEQLQAQEIAVVQVDRGGDITYHGPGQLVGYPIFNLRRLHQQQGQRRFDVLAYIHQIEELLIQLLAGFGLEGWRYKGYTGVWVTTPAGAQKIAAIGIRVNGRGISTHGFALNVQPNLDHFAHIVPCGIHEHGVTSLSECLARPVALTELFDPLTTICGQLLTRPVRFVQPAPAEK